MESDEYLKGKEAKTISDRIDALNQRDKELRKNRETKHHIETASAVIGTCPDMCPEFERYFRQETKQIANLETVIDEEGCYQVDLDKMVKEYRRSGADQEEPLPHELRPPLVLNRTMDYLCTNIMDRNENVSDWYNFVWDRTRAIRKDITQQHLCDLIAVSLTEKCARFHIHCAFALCEEEPKDFDTKINEENLGNCLQSLKDLYHDLSAFKNIKCPNEEEFRCYDILRNLNDRDIVREMQKYDKNIRGSDQVKFAIRVFYALQSNNYIQFFNLLRKATYLNACLMHRYLNKIRLKAVTVMSRAFKSQKTEFVMINSDKLAFCLGFEEIELNLFCSKIGLNFDEQQRKVRLPRVFRHDNFTLSPSRSIIIDSKLTCPIGQVVHGGQLPPNPYRMYQLHDSFDEFGRLKKDSSEVIDQQTNASIFQPKQQLNTSIIQNKEFIFKEPQQPVKFNFLTQTQNLKQSQDQVEIKLRTDQEQQIINEKYSQEVLSELIDNLSRGIILEFFNGQKAVHKFSLIINKVLNEMVYHIALETLEQEKTAKEKQLQKKLILERVCEEIFNEIVDSFVKQQVQEIAATQFSETLKNFNFQCQLLCDDILNQTVLSSVKSISNDVLLKAKMEYQNIISKIKCKRELRLQKKYFSKWKIIREKRKRLEHRRRTFPAAQFYVESQIDKEKLNSSLGSNSMEQATENIAFCLLSNKILKNSSSKRILHLQSKYFFKWKEIWIKNKKLHQRKQRFPAASNCCYTNSSLNQLPLLSTDHTIQQAKDNIERALQSKENTFINKRIYHSSEQSSDDDIQIIDDSDDEFECIIAPPKRRKHQALDELKNKIAQEKQESNLFTTRLSDAFNQTSPAKSHLINTSFSNDEETSQTGIGNEDNENIEVVFYESTEDRLKRLKRLIDEEKNSTEIYTSTLTALINVPSENDDDDDDDDALFIN